MIVITQDIISDPEYGAVIDDTIGTQYQSIN